MRGRRLGAAASVVLSIVGLVACEATPPRSTVVESTVWRVAVHSRDKELISAGADILSARIRALGIGNFTVATGDEMVFTLSAPQLPSDDDLRLVLNHPGVVEFLAWPADGAAPVVGERAPAGREPVFDAATQVASATAIAANGTPAVDVILRPDGARSLASYTAAHVQGYMPLVLDGTILATPVIQSPITGGELAISLAGDGPSPSALAAILASGPLPDGWNGR